MDHFYEIKGAARIVARPFVWTAKAYVQGLRSFVPVTKRALRGIKVVRRPAPATRPPRNYGEETLARAKALFPRDFVRTMKQIGFDNQDVFLARLRTLPLAIAGGHSFGPIWDDAMDDERLSESDKQALATQALEMVEADLRLEGVL